MTSPVIKVEELSKAYRIGLKEQIPDTLVAAIFGLVKAPARKFREIRRLDTYQQNGHAHDTIWALKDVSFEVADGEVLGIIGRNGAGKSTLLKILSRITEPTSGRAVIRGRVSSLLEVGTGFHPELSGRENVYMNGTILGMRKGEIDRKFDEIVAFSGVEKFLDTPIKRYSTGMTVRLAFAVAAHLEPEILIVDEVLAVGDFEFQKRCLGKMHDVAKSGRTVLFVSHQLNAITQLCSRALFIQSGRIAVDGRPEEVVEYYLNEGRAWNDGSRISEWHPDERPTPFFTDILINNTQLPAELILQSNDAISIVLHGDPGNRVLRNFRAGVHVSTQDGIRIMTFATPFASAEHFDVPSRCRLKCTIDRLALIPGTYFLDIGCMDDNGRVDYLRSIARLTVHAGEKTWPGLIPTYKEHGYFVAQSHWTVARSVNGKDNNEMELQLSLSDGAHARRI